MATTATLNGGATGGLLTTTTTAPLIHTENSQTEETCRVESSSSLENEDGMQMENVAPYEESNNTAVTKTTCAPNWGGYDDKSYTDSSPSFMDALSNNYALEGNNNNKKRRKQTRPVRIPASISDGQSFKADRLPGHSKHDESQTISTTARASGKSGQFPLNLSNKLALSSQYNEEEEEECDEDPEEDCDNNSAIQQRSVVYRKGISSLLAESSESLEESSEPTVGVTNETHPHHVHGRNLFSSMIDYNKTEHTMIGQGTKDATTHHQVANYTTTMSSGSSPSSNSVPPSFSPILFPLTGSPSPFSALIPSAAGFFVQQQLQNQQQPIVTSSSSSSAQHQHTCSSNGHGMFDPKLGSLMSSTVGSTAASSLGGSSMQTVPPHRIFNPEAYCDLCNKEFCNKYFLKTHKANKHGVYTSDGNNERNPSSILNLVPANNNNNNNNPATIVAPVSSATSVPGSFQTLSGNLVTNTTTTQSMLIQSGSDVLPTLSQLGKSQTSQSVTTTSGNSMELQLSSSLPYSSVTMATGEKMGSGGSSSSGSQRDSFCELCQKEFCNKYFLKRHKSKIHGISSESTSSSTNRGSKRHSSESKISSDPLFPFNLELSALRNSLSSAGGMNLDTLHSSAAELLAASKVSVDHHNLLLVNNNTGDMNNMHNTTENSNTSGPLSSHDVLKMEEDENSGELCIGDDNNSKGSSTDTKRARLPSNMSQKLPCQFCAREFTNHQLLTNHLLKKHKLLVPPLPQFLFPLQALPSSLFDMESLGNNAAAKSQNDSHNHSSGASSGENDDFECSLCNRSFSSLQLLQVHTTHFHSESDEAKEHLSQLLLKEAAAASIMVNNNVTTDHTASNTSATIKCERENDLAPNKRSMGDTCEEENNRQSSSIEFKNESGKNTPMSATDDIENNDDEDDDRSNMSMTTGLPSSTNHVGRGENTSDSDDLRRLQTMIMELNRVSSAGTMSWSPPLDSQLAPGGNNTVTVSSNNASPSNNIGSVITTSQQANISSSSPLLPSVACHMCSKEFHSPFFLQQHIQQHHGQPNVPVSPGTNVPIKSELPSGSTHQFNDTDLSRHQSGENNSTNNPLSSSSGSLNMMILSGQTGASKDPMRTASVSKGSESSALSRSLSTSNANFLTPSPQHSSAPPQNKGTAPSAGKTIDNSGKRPSPSLSRSYCTICHKELCNKYFMRTHMLKMHGISIESSTGLGGVTCDICKKELCSKYFLKVHKQNTHGIVEEGASPPTPTPGLPASASNAVSTLLGLNLSMGSANHNNNNSSPNRMIMVDEDERDAMICNYSDICPLCGRRCRGSKLLKTHLLSDHGQEGRERWKLMEKNSQRRQKQGKSGRENNNGTNGGGTKNSGGVNKSSKLIAEDSEQGNSKCAFCGFGTGDVELMKIHLLSEHGKHFSGEQAALSEVAAATWQNAARGVVLDPLTMLFQKMDSGAHKVYKCSYCPFSTSLLVYLYAHERTHTGLADSVTAFQNSSLENQVKVESGSELIMGSGNENSGNTTATPSSNTASSGNNASHQCPMCFHTFHSTEVYQQHLLGHQMSGVLAPFFSNGRFPFLASPNSVLGGSADQQSATAAFLSLPLLNGSASGTGHGTLGNSFPWLTKNPEENVDDRLNELKRKLDGDNEDEENKHRDNNKRQTERKTSNDGQLMINCPLKKQKKICYFQCFHCKSKFETRQECSLHVKQEHGTVSRRQLLTTSNHRPQKTNKTVVTRKGFHCRKCKFVSTTYHALLVHGKKQHLRPLVYSVSNPF